LGAQGVEDGQRVVCTAIVHKEELDVLVTENEFQKVAALEARALVIAGDDDSTRGLRGAGQRKGSPSAARIESAESSKFSLNRRERAADSSGLRQPHKLGENQTIEAKNRGWMSVSDD
jgi:hypothetical protein